MNPMTQLENLRKILLSIFRMMWRRIDRVQLTCALTFTRNIVPCLFWNDKAIAFCQKDFPIGTFPMRTCPNTYRPLLYFEELIRNTVHFKWNAIGDLHQHNLHVFSCGDHLSIESILRSVAVQMYLFLCTHFSLHSPNKKLQIVFLRFVVLAIFHIKMTKMTKDKNALKTCSFENMDHKLITPFNDPYLKMSDACMHENKQLYTEEEKKKSQIKIAGYCGYCIDCGTPLFDDCPSDTSPSQSSSIGACTHPTVKEDTNGVSMCAVCFVEMTEQLSFEPEWNMYTDSSRSSKDPSRCHGQRGPSSRGLASFFDDHKVQIDKARLARIEEKYRHITGQSASKGQCRAGIIAACLFRDLRTSGETRTSDYVKGLFGLTKKQISTGLATYYECFPEESKDYITATDLVPWLMSTIGIGKEHEPKITKLTQILIDGDPIFKRATPQSVASSVIYFYLCLNPEYKKSLGMNKTKFAEKSELSDLTISKLVSTISARTGCKVEI